MRALVVLGVVGLLSGCAGGQALLQEGAGAGGRLALVRTPEGPVLTQDGQGVWLASGQPWRPLPGQAQWLFEAALATRPAAPQRFQLYFERDGQRLLAASEAVLNQVLAEVRQPGPKVVMVIGHTDTVGEAAINARVGLVRARRIAERIGRAGGELLELRVASHGEANPLVRTPDGVRQPRNRRVEVAIFR